MTAIADRTAFLSALVERADQARAQAMANHARLERTLTRSRDFGPIEECSLRAERPASLAAAEARIAELEDTIAGLWKRMESQGPIEQAKGIIIAQNHCNADHAFEILRRASQRSNTKLRTLAEDLVARTGTADPRPSSPPGD